jgi:hypothetical protein
MMRPLAVQAGLSTAASRFDLEMELAMAKALRKRMVAIARASSGTYAALPHMISRAGAA